MCRSVCKNEWAPLACPVPTEVRKGHQVCWNGSCSRYVVLKEAWRDQSLDTRQLEPRYHYTLGKRLKLEETSSGGEEVGLLPTLLAGIQTWKAIRKY